MHKNEGKRRPRATPGGGLPPGLCKYFVLSQVVVPQVNFLKIHQGIVKMCYIAVLKKKKKKTLQKFPRPKSTTLSRQQLLCASLLPAHPPRHFPRIRDQVLPAVSIVCDFREGLERRGNGPTSVPDLSHYYWGFLQPGMGKRSD